MRINNDYIDGVFLTERKQSTMTPNRGSQFNVTKVDNTTAARTLDQSPDMTMSSPSALVSFNFLTQIPLEDFVETENKKADEWIKMQRSKANALIE